MNPSEKIVELQKKLELLILIGDNKEAIFVIKEIQIVSHNMYQDIIKQLSKVK